ncbi:MAG: sulfotransferase [Oscillatoriales cyanobacterium]|nr:MAG: sulfotransferase [Oscillatoriales cyanobacterium]
MKPKFLIIGVQKGGTTSLYQYLLDHPQVLPATTKEVHFFDLQWHLGLDWYLNQFPDQFPDQFPGDRVSEAGIHQSAAWMTGEASPYYVFHPLVPQRVWEFDPSLKIIVLLRNPVDRALSHYYHEVRWGFETLDIEAAFAAETDRLAGELAKFQADPHYQSYAYQHYSYAARGCYREQLEAWRSRFGADQMLVLNSERFYQSTADSLQRVVNFLGLQPYDFPGFNNQFEKYNAGEYSLPDQDLKRLLQGQFQVANQQLKDYLQREFSADWQAEFADRCDWLGDCSPPATA